MTESEKTGGWASLGAELTSEIKALASNIKDFGGAVKDFPTDVAKDAAEYIAAKQPIHVSDHELQTPAVGGSKPSSAEIKR